MALMRSLTKADYKQTAILTAKIVAILLIAFAAVIFTPILRLAGYRDANPAKAIALAVEAIVIVAFVVAATELIKRWLGWRH